MMTTPSVGTRVVFRTDSPQYARCKGITYTVETPPAWSEGEPTFSTDQHGEPYVWLVMTEDIDTRTPSRRRRRSGWVRNLDRAATSERLPMPWETTR